MLLLLAVAILAAGFWWDSLVWSGGEYAQPPPSLGHKLGEVLPWAAGTLALAAIPGVVGAILISASRPTDAYRADSSKRRFAFLTAIVVVSLAPPLSAVLHPSGGRYGMAAVLTEVAVIDAFLIIVFASTQVFTRARKEPGRAQTRIAR